MFPRLHLPGLPFGIPTYGLMLATGFLVALWLAERLGRAQGFRRNDVQDTAVWACLAGLIGAKVALLVVEPAPWREIWRTLFQGGVFYGGFAAAVLAVLWRSRRLGVSPHAMGDVLVAPLALGHAFGRFGCFLAGCCFGSACEAPWAVHYHDAESLPVLAGIAPETGLHPVQLYEAAGNLGLAAMSLLLLARRRFAGQVVWTYIAAYGAFRFVVEFWRGDPRGHLGPLSTSQVGGLLAIVAGGATLAACVVTARRQERAQAAEAEALAQAPPAEEAGATEPIP